MSIVIIEVNGEVIYSSPDVAILDLDSLPDHGADGDWSADDPADHFATALAAADGDDDRKAVERAARSYGVTSTELEKAVALYAILHPRSR